MEGGTTNFWELREEILMFRPWKAKVKLISRLLPAKVPRLSSFLVSTHASLARFASLCCCSRLAFDLSPAFRLQSRHVEPIKLIQRSANNFSPPHNTEMMAKSAMLWLCLASPAIKGMCATPRSHSETIRDIVELNALGCVNFWLLLDNKNIIGGGSGRK
jgi:hypothetical protein